MDEGIVYSADHHDGPQDLLSILPPADVQQTGLAAAAIVGRLRQPLVEGGRITPDNLVVNKTFVDFLHDFLRRAAPDEVGLRAEAARQGDGWVYILDDRTPTPQGSVPPEDIIGALQVEGGQVLQDSYQRNDRHQVLTGQGLTRLPATLQKRLLDELRGLR